MDLSTTAIDALVGKVRFNDAGLVAAIAQDAEKGDTSGHTQTVHDLLVDCDGDTLLMKITQVGAACHTGERTCFFTSVKQL